MRADQLVLKKGLAPTRSAAQRLIESGAVRWRETGVTSAKWALPRKAGEDLPENCEIEVTDDAELRYVSRGGLKLEGALATCGIAVKGRRCLDIGQGTGGFTDVLLQRGASVVVGIEVGHGQLHAKLRGDPRVHCYEGLNGRDLTGSDFLAEQGVGSFELIVGDVSFITLTHILPTVLQQAAAGSDCLLLVKPQFELQPEHIGKGGIVKDKASHAIVETRIWQAAKGLGFKVHQYFESGLAGGDGNREFFVWASPKGKTT